MRALNNRAEILYWIFRSLDGNFIETGIAEDGKPYAITDSWRKTMIIQMVIIIERNLWIKMVFGK